MSSLSEAPLHSIKKNLERIFGAEWFEYEPETISLELGIEFDALLLDKIYVLKCLYHNPGIFWGEPLFTMHASKVLNNEPANFDSVPSVTSLELIWAATQVDECFGIPTSFANGAFIEIARHVLTSEGFSVVPEELKPLCPGLVLTAGQLPEDIAAKEHAIELYVNHMSKLGK